MKYLKVKVHTFLLACLLILPAVSYAQQKSVDGVVTDLNGLPLTGSTIAVKGTTKAAIAGLDGKYTMSGVEAGQVLVFSFVGYRTQELTVGSQTTYNVALEEASEMLEELVVTALGIKRAEKALSYNVQKISNDELTAVKDANFVNSLIGKVAGVTINSSAGGSGAPAKVVMRGAKSISKDNNAIYVIDGIPMFNSSFGNSEGKFAAELGSEAAADINPDDIESITVLTGPSAAALYGNEGANGVILITTKKGRADKTVVTVSNSTTFSTPFVLPKFQNKYGNSAGAVDSWGAEQTKYHYNPANFFNTGASIINTVSLATGSDKSQSFFSAAATNSTGIIPNNSYDRYNFSYRNTTAFLDNKFLLDVSAGFIMQSDKNMMSQGLYLNPLPAVYLFPRGENFDEIRTYKRYDPVREVDIPYWNYSDYGLEITNPYWKVNRMVSASNKKRHIASASLQYNITGWFNITGRAKIDNSYYISTNKRHAGTPTTLAGENGFFAKTNRYEAQFYGDVIANINKKLSDDFNLTANLGASIKDIRMDLEKQEGNLRYANIFSTENLIRPAGYKVDADGYTDETQSVFANLEMGYKSMLYLTVTGRNDWASQLAFSNHTSFFYPSVGLSGIISDMVNLPSCFSFLKARLSYSSVGTPYDRYLTQFFYEYNRITNSYDASKRYPYYDLKPELTNSLEAGLNMRFFKGALTLDATYYKSNTLNQTFMAPLNKSTGWEEVPVQAGDVQNSGMELMLGYHHTWDKFSWSTSLTYSFNNNKINKLANGITNPVDGSVIDQPFINKDVLGDDGAPFIRLTEGGTLGDLYVNKALKRDENGNYSLNAAGVPTMQDLAIPEKIGSTLAKSNMGWSNTFSWNGIDLGVVLSARFGGLVISNTQAVLDRYGVSEASRELREKGMTINGKEVNVKEWYAATTGQTSGIGAHYTYSATNVRLQELSLNYTLPAKLIGNVSKLSVGLVGRNLAMIYCKAPFDPELSPSTNSTFYSGVDYFMQPSLRNIGLNVKIQF